MDFRSVQFENGTSPGDKILDASAWSLSADSPQFQVSRFIILSIPIFVMHMLRSKQWTPKNLAHDIAMLSNISLGARQGIIGDKKINISVAVNHFPPPPSCPSRASHEPRMMAMEKTHGISIKFSEFRAALFGYLGFVTASAFAKTGGNQFSRWLEALSLISRLTARKLIGMAQQESRRSISMMGSGWNYSTAPTLAFAHVHYFNQLHQACQETKA